MISLTRQQASFWSILYTNIGLTDHDSYSVLTVIEILQLAILTGQGATTRLVVHYGFYVSFIHSTAFV